MPSEFTITRQVEFYETDMAGIMHFSNFFKWMESCEVALYRSLGLPLVSLVPGQVVGWPRVKAACQYFSPLRFNDVADVKLHVKTLGVRSITYVFHIRSGGKLAALGEVTVVCVTTGDQGELAPQPLPESVRALLQPAPESAWSAP